MRRSSLLPNLSRMIRRNPLRLGHSRKGAPLGQTFGECLGTSGTGHYCGEDGLVPNGVRALWHFFMVVGETDPFIGTFDLPVAALDGSRSVVVADRDGPAKLDQTIASALQLSGELLTAGLALNWHSDGMIYGVLPGDFGETAHIQLFTDLPSEAGR